MNMNSAVKGIRFDGVSNFSTAKSDRKKNSKGNLEEETESLKQYFELPSNEQVKEVFDCQVKGSVGIGNIGGRLYLCQAILCFVGKKMFGHNEHAKIWSLADLLDLSAVGTKSFQIVSVTNKKLIFTGFEDGTEGRDHALKDIKRLFFGLSGNSVLHTAVADGSHEKVKAILDRDVTKLMEFNLNEQTPLILACIKNDFDMVNLLLSYYRNNKDVDINQTTPKGSIHQLHSICRLREIDDNIMKTLLEFPGINVSARVAYDKTTPLHYFCEHNHSLACAEIGELFIKAGADVNAQTEQGETPLHKAIFNSRVKVIMMQMLLRNKAKVDIKGGHRGDTPLHYAIRLIRLDLVTALIEAGADLRIKNNEDKDCLELAKEELKLSQKPENQKIIELLDNLKILTELLIEIELEELIPQFISQKLYRLDALLLLNEDRLNELGLNIKMGPKIKLIKEIESLKEEMEKVRKRKLSSAEEALQRQDIGFSADAIRHEFADLGDGQWEIDTEELEFTAKLGSGTSGQVFRGLFRDREVAIKVLHASDAESELDEFKKEFKILSSVKSPYMIKFYGATLEPNLCMVMEYCERGSLYDVLQNLNLQWDKAISFASDMAEGMAALHEHEPPIIHRDLKTLNLLVNHDWRVKVCDFGLSRSVSGDMGTFTKLCGTFAYCAPEIFKGFPATEKSDVYSMGIALWELLNSATKHKYEYPYVEFNFNFDFQVLVLASQGLRPTIPPKAQDDFVQLFKKCVNEDSQKRPKAREVAQILKQINEEYQKDKESWKNKYYKETESDREMLKLLADENSEVPMADAPTRTFSNGVVSGAIAGAGGSYNKSEVEKYTEISDNIVNVSEKEIINECVGLEDVIPATVEKLTVVAQYSVLSPCSTLNLTSEIPKDNSIANKTSPSKIRKSRHTKNKKHTSMSNEIIPDYNTKRHKKIASDQSDIASKKINLLKSKDIEKNQPKLPQSHSKLNTRSAKAGLQTTDYILKTDDDIPKKQPKTEPRKRRSEAYDKSTIQAEFKKMQEKELMINDKSKEDLLDDDGSPVNQLWSQLWSNKKFTTNSNEAENSKSESTKKKRIKFLPEKLKVTKTKKKN